MTEIQPPRDSRTYPGMAPMINPAFDPLRGPKPLTCCECGGPLKNETYRVLRGQNYCDACANTES